MAGARRGGARPPRGAPRARIHVCRRAAPGLETDSRAMIAITLELLQLTALAATGEMDGCDVFVAAGSDSIAHAQHEIQARLGSDATDGEDLVVCLGGGVHSVGAGGVTMTGADAPVGGGRRVVWRGSGSAAAPTIVSGGVQVTGWTAAVPGTADGLYVAPVPTAAKHLQAIRQLWVGGQRANRTSTLTPGCLMNPPAGAPPPPGCRVNQTSACAFNFGANRSCCPGQQAQVCTAAFPICQGYVADARWGKCAGSDPTASGVFTAWTTGNTSSPTALGFTAGKALPKSWMGKNGRNIEFVWPGVVRDWTEPRCTLQSVVGANITLSTRCALLLNGMKSPLPPPVRVEAAPPEGPLAQGEFWHDAEKELLYYQLSKGQTAAELLSDAWIGTEEAIVTYDGNLSGYHTWEKVAFQYSTWLQPNSADGLVDNQALTYHCSGTPCGNCTGSPGSATCQDNIGGSAPGAIRIISGAQITFNACNFSHIGSGYTLSISGTSQGVTIVGCFFSDLSGGFLKLEDGQHFSISNNSADNMAIEYAGAPAIFSQFIAHSTIAHNSISNTAYSGISQGWGWGSYWPAGHATYGNISINHNKITKAMARLHDGGAMYFNGCTNKALGANVISYNYVDQDLGGTTSTGIGAAWYFDNGASNWQLTNNVATSSRAFAYFMAGSDDPNTPCVGPDAHNIAVSNLWYQGTGSGVSHCAVCGCKVDIATTHNVPRATPLPAQAKAIVAAAGAGTLKAGDVGLQPRT